jgi:hypothetical protein
MEVRLTRHDAGIAYHTTAVDPPLKLLFMELQTSFESPADERRSSRNGRARRRSAYCG